MKQYRIMRSAFGDSLVLLYGENGMAAIPEIPGNRHYEEYLEWIAEGNEPEVIDD